jgi:hypothetical protein
MKAKSPLSSRFSHLATAGLVAGSLLATKPAANAQGYVGQYGGTVSILEGTGNGVPNGATVSGTINYNLSQFAWNSTYDAFIDPYATETETINGTTTSFTGLEAEVILNAPDYNGNPSDTLYLSWGNGYNDGIGTTEPAILSGGDTLLNIQTLANLGLTEAVSYGPNDYHDNSFTVGSDASGVNQAGGTLITFQVEATPEPGTLALGGLGAAALAAAKLRSRIKQTHARKPVGLNVGM